MKKLSTLLIALTAICAAQAQSISPQVIGSSGGYYTSTGATLSSTCGEPVIETVNSSTAIITQGFQQPESSGVGILEPGVSINVNIYPNPTFGNVRVEIGEPTSDYTVHLFDITGKQLSSYRHPQNQSSMEIDLTNLAGGNYMLKISDHKKTSVTYRIQKMR